MKVLDKSNNLNESDIQRVIAYYASKDMADLNVDVLFKIIFSDPKVMAAIDWNNALEIFLSVRPYLRGKLDSILDEMENDPDYR